jgi:hypothetical protein
MVVLPGREAADAREVLRRTRARANADTAAYVPRPTYHMTPYPVEKCKPPIETSHASPIEMSLRHSAVGTFEVMCDGWGDPDERSGIDPAARDD